MPAEKAPTMASSGYRSAPPPAAGAAGLAPPDGDDGGGGGPPAATTTATANISAALDESWDPQIIAAGGEPVAAANAAAGAGGGEEGQRRKTFGKRGTTTPTKGRDDYGPDRLNSHDGDDDDQDDDPRAEAERQTSNPVLACVDDASVLFREKVNCEYFEERQPSPRKDLSPNHRGLPPTQAQQQRGRVVTVGGQTTTTQVKGLAPPSPRGARGARGASGGTNPTAAPPPGGVRGIIEQSERMADEPSPHTARKSQAFFSQFDISDVPTKSTDLDEGGDDNENNPAEDDDDDDMPEDELNESRGRSRSFGSAANAAGGARTPRDGPSPSTVRGGGDAATVATGVTGYTEYTGATGYTGQTDYEEEEGIMAGITRTITEYCQSPSSTVRVSVRETGGDGAAVEDMPPNALDVDICTYLQTICGTPAWPDDGEAPPPPPPLPPAEGAGSSPSRRSPGSAVRAVAIGGGAAAAAAGVAVGATAANSPGRRNTFDEADDQEGLSTSMNGKAAQLDLSRASAKSGAGQQENTAIEVEYVDPDCYTSDEDEDQDEYDHRGRPVAAAAGGAAAAVGAKKKKDKKKGRGISKGLSKMFGKAQASKKRDTDPAKVAAAAAAAAGAGAAIATHGDEAGTLTDEDESQGTADHVGDDVEEEPQVVRVPVAPGSEGWTVDEKNAHLQAMASKARDSYMYGKGSPPPSPKRGAAAHVSDGVPDDSSVPEDDYADWRPSEKRRFLQLLSQGMSPREAAREIKNARRGIDAESPQAGATADEGGTPDDEAALDESGAVEGDGEVEGEQAQTSTNPFNDDEEKSTNPFDDDDSPLTAAAVAAGAAAVTAAGVAAVLNQSDDEEANASDVLKKTGLGYYDGVKRIGFADEPADVPPSSVRPPDVAAAKSTKRGILPVTLKTKGFSSLDSEVNAREDRRKRNNIKSLFAGNKNKAAKDGFSTLDSDSENELEDNYAGERSVAATKEKESNDDDSIFDDLNEDKTVEAGTIGASAPSSVPPETISDDHTEPVPSSDMSVVSGVTMSTEYTDAMTVGTAYTNASTKSTRRRHRGAAKKRLTKAKEAEDGASVGWLDSIRTAAANNNRVWDPQLGWVDYEEPEKGDDSASADRIGSLSLPVKSRGTQQGNDPSQRPGAAGSVPFPENWEEERSQMLGQSHEADGSGLDAIDEDDASDVPDAPNAPSRAARGAAVVGTTAATAAVASAVINSRGAPDDASALTEHSTSQSAVTERRGAPKGWVESMRAASERVSAADPNRRWDPQHGWIGLPPETMPPTAEEEAQEAARGVPDGTVGTNDSVADSGPAAHDVALNRSTLSERSAGPVDLDDSDYDDDDSSVEGEKKEEETVVSVNTNVVEIRREAIRPDPSGIVHESEDAIERPLSETGARMPFNIKLPPPRTGRGRGAAQQETTADDSTSAAPAVAAAAVGAAAVAASSLPPMVPKKDRPDSAEKSAPEVQVVKLKMSEKDKDLFLNKDDSNHFIDDTTFAPEFADESPFSTPSRTAPRGSGIEADGDGIVLDTTQSDIVKASPTKSDVAAGADATKKSRDPPQSVAPTSAGEGGPSVSSRAKQWMELIESKSKSRTVPGGKEAAPAANAAGTSPTPQDPAVAWPGAGSSARNALKFAAADGGSEADFMSETGVPPSRPTESRVEKNAKIGVFQSANPLKSKLQNMNSSRVTEVSDASSGGGATSTEGDDKGGKKSMFKRLTECAGPVLPTACANPTLVDDTGEEVPVSHLEYLKKKSKVGSSLAPSALCGKPDTIYEEGSDGKGRSRKKSASTSSVVSGDGFGAKNAYLDAVNLKAATGTRGRSTSTGRPSSRGRSSSSQRSGQSAESWQGFLERRSASKSPGPIRPPTSPPVAGETAEQKAAQKVEEMMKSLAMNTKSKADIDDMIETMSQASGTAPIQATRSNVSSNSQTKKKSESAKAAEELAAARVEAMMKAMSSQKLE